MSLQIQSYYDHFLKGCGNITVNLFKNWRYDRKSYLQLYHCRSDSNWYESPFERPNFLLCTANSVQEYVDVSNTTAVVMNIQRIYIQHICIENCQMSVTTTYYNKHCWTAGGVAFFFLDHGHSQNLPSHSMTTTCRPNFLLRLSLQYLHIVSFPISIILDSCTEILKF